MEIRETFYARNRKEWRSWLEDNFSNKKEIWLIYYKKNSGKERISYNDAVEVALCFGWIDSTAKRIDDEKYAQRFTPRRKGSSFSQTNKERLRWLLENGLIHPSVKKQTKKIVEDEYEFPKDIIKQLKNNNKAWENFETYSDSYKRIRIAYIDSARNQPEEFSKRLNSFIKSCEKNKKIGFGIDKYY